jgi:hypothetical protein
MTVSEVLQRLDHDDRFRVEVLADPARALSQYHLTADDLKIIEDHLGVRPAAQRGWRELLGPPSAGL